MDAKEKVDSELSWGFCGSYLFGSDYKDDSTILNEFGWNYIPADFDPDFSRSGEGGDATVAVAVVEESSTSASVLESNPSEKSTASGSSTAANPPPERVKRNKGKKQGEKRIGEARFAFVTKSEIDHLEDGYRWRKYGQKAVKNSPFPRSYYRCSESKCRVKKRVERSWEDSSVVITTYEGQHCHHHSLSLNPYPRLLQLRTPPPQTQGLLGDIVGNG